jgi:hypothetical protein
MCPKVKVPVSVTELLFHRDIPYGQILNFAVEWVAVQLRLREIPVRNLSPETYYPYLEFLFFPQLVQELVGIIPEVRTGPRFYVSFPVCYSMLYSLSC